MRIANPSEENRPARGGWEPGNYVCHCHKCARSFIGDKRAVTCSDCAYQEKPR